MAGARASSLNEGAPAFLRPVLDAVDRLCRLDGWIAGGCLLALTTLMICEVVVSGVANSVYWLRAKGLDWLPAELPASVPNAWEYSSYLMAASFTFGAAMTLRAGGHIRVTLLLARLSPGRRRLLEIVAALAGLVMSGFLAYSMMLFTWGSYMRGATSISSDTPVWVPQALITFGIALLALQFVTRFLQAVCGLQLEDPRLRLTSASE
ncbi:MAG: TRAP transporter small permease [Alphaproteobacteria bacterium]|nr:TRAP transporter small permease [Alphaproteobacteria bacterium]MCW5742700.1 TRAP transporter small permease [Alphaproteobacteria bacterium]